MGSEGRKGFGRSATGWRLLAGGWRSEAFAAVHAVVGGGVMAVLSAFAAGSLVALHLSAELGGDDAGGYGENGETGEHDGGGGEFSCECDGCHIAVADGGDGDNGPVDGLRDAGEALVVGVFDDIDDGALDADEGTNGEQKDEDFVSRGAQGRDNDSGLIDVVRHFKDTENAHQSKDTNDGEIMRSGEQKLEPPGKNREQIDDTEKAGDVFSRYPGDPDSDHIFEGKYCRKYPFQRPEPGTPFGSDFWNAIEHHDADAGSDEQEQREIETPPCRGVRSEDDAPESFAER